MNTKDLIIWIAEYSYRKANPDSKMDVPSIVYEQVEKDFNKKFPKLEQDGECQHCENGCKACDARFITQDKE